MLQEENEMPLSVKGKWRLMILLLGDLLPKTRHGHLCCSLRGKRCTGGLPYPRVIRYFSVTCPVWPRGFQEV
jgi:hypothetical protein